MTGGLGGGLSTQDAGRTLQGVDVRLELFDLGLPGRDGVGDRCHGEHSTDGVVEVSMPLTGPPHADRMAPTSAPAFCSRALRLHDLAIPSSAPQ